MITAFGAGLQPPARVEAVVARLESGLDQGGYLDGLRCASPHIWLSLHLHMSDVSQESIKNDADVGFRRFPSTAFSNTATYNLSDPALAPATRAELEYRLKKLKRTYQGAVHFYDKGRNENAWCDDVVRPIIKLALRLYAKGKLSLQSVQSQSVDSHFLPRLMESSREQRVLDRKIDYILSYSDDALSCEGLYTRLLQQRDEVVSHTIEAYTRTTTVFSGVEVKASDGNTFGAQYQLSIWMDASLRKKAQLARRVGLADTSCLVEPSFKIVGHELTSHVAYISPEQDDIVHIQEFGSVKSNTISGVFQQLKMWQKVVEYGLDESSDSFLGRLSGARVKMTGV